MLRTSGKNHGLLGQGILIGPVYDRNSKTCAGYKACTGFLSAAARTRIEKYENFAYTVAVL